MKEKEIVEMTAEERREFEAYRLEKEKKTQGGGAQSPTPAVW